MPTTASTNHAQVGARGEHGKLAPKITDAQVVEIRQRRANGETRTALAEAYNLSLAYLGHLVLGNVRKDAGGPITKPWSVNARKRFFVVGDKKLSETEAAAALGLTRTALAARLSRGWSVNDALSKVLCNQIPAIVLCPGPSIAYVPLVGEKGFACINSENAERVGERSWRRGWNGNKHYVFARYLQGDQVISVTLKQFVSGIDSEMIQPVNGNQFDCRRQNLRALPAAEKAWKAKLRKNNTTGYLGVYRTTKRNQIKASLSTLGQNARLGSFETLEDAARAVDKEILRSRGDRGRLNLPSAPLTHTISSDPGPACYNRRSS